MGKLFVLNHPLIQHKISMMRKTETTTKDFRELANEISLLMAYEVTRDLPLEEKEIETPICKTNAKFIAGRSIGVVPILRAGLGMVDGIKNLIPTAKIGHIGLYRDEETKMPMEYFVKLPKLENSVVFVLDPMLATGGSAVKAIDIMKAKGAKVIKMICLVGVDEGINAVTKAHPDVDIYLASKDEKLNENAYIVPGLGDAGDRLFGTK